jgi:hypothetical protein
MQFMALVAQMVLANPAARPTMKEVADFVRRCQPRAR